MDFDLFYIYRIFKENLILMKTQFNWKSFVDLGFFFHRFQQVEYEAFCTWTISVVEGLLTAADLSIGLVHYKNRYYAFSRIDAADSFMENPDT